MALWQPKGSEELALVWVPAVCPKEKPVEKAPLINPHCPEGCLFGKERHELEGVYQASFISWSQVSGTFGALVGQGEGEGETAGK